MFCLECHAFTGKFYNLLSPLKGYCKLNLKKERKCVMFGNRENSSSGGKVFQLRPLWAEPVIVTFT